MTSLFVAGTFILGLVSPILCLTRKRKYVWFAFALFGIFTPTIFGFMSASNLLIGGKLWSILDILFVFLLIFGWPLSQKDVFQRQRSGIDNAVFLLVILTGIAFCVGYARQGQLSGVLNIFRSFMFIPAYFAASNILSNPRDVRLFYKWVMAFTMVVFVFHVMLMLRIYVPPMYAAAESRYEQEQFTEVVRPIMFFGEIFYIISAAVSLTAIKYGKGKKLYAFAILLLSVLGALFTQTRSLYGAMALVFLAFFGFGKGKAKAMLAAVFSGLAVLLLVALLQHAGLNVFSRFTGDVEGYSGGWRAAEYRSLLSALAESPLGLLVGQGFGASHTVLDRTVPYFHNEYIQTFFSLGLPGFLAYSFLIAAGIFKGRYFSEESDDMAMLLMPVRISFFAMAGMAVFFPVLWSAKTIAIVISMLAISRNSDWLMQQLYNQQLSIDEQGVDLAMYGSDEYDVANVSYF